jgi:uncharacterized protein (TIGR03435 family)
MLNNRSCKNFKVIGAIMVARTCLALDMISRLNAQSQAATVPAEQLQQPAPRVEFEVVSVKPGDPNDPSSSGRSTPGGMEMRNTTLNTLVRSAYGLNEFQLVGGPKWAASAKFNVVAKMPPGATHDQMPLMMQSMLADRFKLEFHRETRALQEYALEVAKGGSRLQDATEEDKAHAGTSQGPRQIKARSATPSDLARMLISVVGAPVLDRTGIKGQYNIALQFAPLLGGTPTDDNLPDIFAALHQLGLKLEPIKGPVEVVVIDSAAMPSEN